MKVPDKLELYRLGAEPLKRSNRFWPLYGAGLENLGRDGEPIEEPIPQYGPDELLIRHDACGLCFSDIKVIKLGQGHPRIFKDIQHDPVVLGHEISITVVGVGDNLKDQYAIGDRFIVQADIWKNGVNLAYGYMLRGGLAQYNVIGDTILKGDQGNYLLPVEPQTGYAESALTEPWACVTAAYGLTYRTGLKDGGTAWVIGTPDAAGKVYTIGAGFDATSHPARLMLSNVPAAFGSWLRGRAAELGMEVAAVDDLDAPPFTPVDDIVLLAPDPELIEKVSPHLAYLGVCALIGEKPMARKVSADLGRVHYNRWVYVGGTGPDIAAAYSDVPVRASLRPGGAAWFVGAGGPMGRMHVQRAIQVPDNPATMVCTDVSDMRLEDLNASFRSEAEAKGIEFICLNPTDRETYAAGMARFRAGGFDDIVVLAPVAPVIADSATWLAPQGVMNVFAGVARGTIADLDLADAYLKQARVIGHSASSIDDLRLMLYQAETGTLSPNRSVAAVGSLEAALSGFQAVMDTSFPGKVVIYPHIKELPLTALADLKDVLPSVYAKLKDGREWTNEAEAEFLRVTLE
jgi:D-arabinose 1-dehydrogenase-like Zn-dependent alcohol dehydrogenase